MRARLVVDIRVNLHPNRHQHLRGSSYDEKVQLPPEVRSAIEEQAEAVGFRPLQQAVAAMSEAYRGGRVPALPPEERVAAYLVTRMPATYAAAFSVLRQLSHLPIASVLDIGAGAGAASLPARQIFPHASITMIERDPAMSAAARGWLPDAALIQDDVTRLSTLPPHDLVIAAYSAGEFGVSISRKLWQAAKVALALIEPGTPRGFTLIRSWRGELIEAGAHMIAPCPAATACPVVDPDWCHFAARVERSSWHRKLKGGALGYEDEKFSYVAVAREPTVLPAGRIVRRPEHHPGLILLQTCTADGFRTQRVTKRERDAFRLARRAAWGDAGIS